MAAPETRPTLILRLRDHDDSEAWSTFAALYGPLIANFCRRAGLQEADARDVSQEALHAVAGAVRTFDYDPSRGAFHTWLLTFVRHRLQRFFRSRQRLPEPLGSGIGEMAEENLHEPSGWQGPEEDEAWNADYRRIVFAWAKARVRDQVRGSTWEAFRRTALEGDDPETVAAELGLSVGAVYIAKSRVLARLKAAVDEIESDHPLLTRHLPS